MLHSLYDFFLVIVAITALMGIFSRVFEDTLLQRIGMCVICFGAIVELICSFYTCGNGNAALLRVGGVALYGTATTIKHWKRARWVRKFGKSMKG